MGIVPRTWRELNDDLRGADEEACLCLLLEERAGRARLRHMLRIHARYNKLRGRRERRELRDDSGKG